MKTLEQITENTIEKMRKIVADKQAAKIDGVMVDMFTASAVTQIYDKVNDANKKKMEKLKAPKLADLAFKIMQKNSVDEGKKVECPKCEGEGCDHCDNTGYHMTAEKKLPRQLKDPKKEVMVSKGGKTIVIDKSKEKEYLRKGWGLAEGTWALPKSAKEKKMLKDLMKNPIVLGKDGDDASSKMYNLIGDDELFDDLYVAGKKNPKGDARPVIQKHMKRLGIKEETLTEEEIVYRVRDIQRPEETKFKNVQRMGVAVSMKKQGKDTIITVKGTKKNLRDVDSVVRGKSSYGDPSTIKHFDEAVSPAQQAAIAISKKEKGEEPKKESRAKRAAMRDISRDKDFARKDDEDISATDDDRKAADKNPIIQLRRIADLPRGGDMEFKDGKKVKISQDDAKKALKGFSVMRKPQDKDKFTQNVGRSLKDLKRILKIIR